MKYKRFLELILVMTSTVILSSCGKAVQMQEVTPSPSLAVEASVVSEEDKSETPVTVVENKGLEERLLLKGYVAQVIEDNAPITAAYNSSDIVANVPKDELLNVTHELYNNNQLLNIVKVEYIKEDGSTLVGYIEDKYLTFDIQIADAAILDESQAVEEPIEEEVVEQEVEQTIEQAEQAEDPVIYMPDVKLYDAPVTKYTNTNCNVRQFDSKDSNLITTLALNTAVTVFGTTESGWSQVQIDGVNSYIKSSLLSDSKTEVKKQEATSSQPAKTSEQASSPAPKQSGDVTVQQPSQSDAQFEAQLDSLADSLFGGQGNSQSGYTGTTGSQGWGGDDIHFE